VRVKPITAEQVASVVTQLRQREKSHRAKGWALILGAIPLLFVGPLFIGTCVYFLDRHREHYSTAGWIGAVALTAAFAIPLLFLFERLNGEGLMTSTAEAVGQADYSRLAGRAGAGVLIIDIFCWGPRMVLSGFRRFASNSVVTECDHQLAAQWICKLLRLEQGTLTPEIVDGNDPKSVPTLTYLCKYEWIDISTNGERIWLLSDARKVLTAP
jgi:hypothetical protein